VFEGARNPYVVLITIYIFMPYVTSSMVGDPVRGQEIVSRWSQYSGWFIMLTAPFLGASIDQMGRRKIWLALAVAAMVPMMFALWWGKADGTGLSVTGVMILATVIGILFTYTEVLHNSLLVRAAGPSAARTILRGDHARNQESPGPASGRGQADPQGRRSDRRGGQGPCDHGAERVGQIDPVLCALGP
jgi:MFS-type transporter involved in bile tolerance (Atg22 family)